MSEFIILLDMDEYDISLSIIESFSCLLINLSNITSLYYICSNNFINQIISKDYSMYDDNFISYYISFIKSLALRIDHNSIQCFYRNNVNSFPLVQCALRFYNFHDSMIRTCVQTTILTILRIKYDKIQDHFIQLPTVEYFIFIVLHLKDLIYKLNEEILSLNQSNITKLLEDIQDDILYINDLFALHLEKINYALLNTMLYYLILPVLCGSLVTLSKPTLSMSLSIYIMIMLMENIKDECFSNVLFSIIFSTKQPLQMTENYTKIPEDSKNYSSHWTKHKVLHLSFLDFVTDNYSEGFLLSLLYVNNIVLNTTQVFPEFKEINAKARELKKDITAEDMKQIVQDYFNRPDVKDMVLHHKNVSNSIGLNVGLFVGTNTNEPDQFDPDAIIGEILKHFQVVKTVNLLNISSKDIIKNEVKENIKNFLKSKDDNLILIINMMIYHFMQKDIAVSLTHEAQLFNYNKKSEKVSDILSLGNIFNNNTSLTNNIIPESHSINDTNVSFDSFLFNNQYFSTNTNVSFQPDCILIEILLNLFLIDPPLRKITSELILLNIYNMLIDDTTKTLQVILPPEINLLFKQIYLKTITHINDLIQSSEVIKDKGYVIFKEEWSIYSNNMTPISQFKSLFNKPDCLIPNNLQENIKNYPTILQQQTSDVDLLKYYLLIYMKISDLQVILFDKEKGKPLIRNHFPMITLTDYEFQLDTVYDISSLNESNSIIQCAKIKMKKTKECLDIVIIIACSFIYFGVYEKDKNYAKITHKNMVKNTSMSIDLNQGKTISVIFNEDKESQIDLIFDSVESATRFEWNFHDWRITVINEEKAKFSNYFNEMKTKANQ